MKLTQRQEVAIDILLSTHRELTAVDVVEYSVEESIHRGTILTVKSGEYTYKYKILSVGAVVKMYQGNTENKFWKVRYFSDKQQS